MHVHMPHAHAHAHTHTHTHTRTHTHTHTHTRTRTHAHAHTHTRTARNTPFLWLQVLVIDEADRILEIGFEEDMRAIIKFLPKKGRQTALFSATQTQNVAALARLAIEHKPVYVAAQQSAENSTVSTLEQGFVVCEASHRFMLLFTFLKKNLKKKACPLQACACSTRVYTLRVRCVCTA